MITQFGLNKITEAMKNIIYKGKYTVDGVVKDIDLYDTTLTNNVFTIRLYLDDNVVGKLTDYQLVDTQGNVLIDKADNIDKLETRGLLLIFNITITEG